MGYVVRRARHGYRRGERGDVVVVIEVGRSCWWESRQTAPHTASADASVPWFRFFGSPKNGSDSQLSKLDVFNCCRISRLLPVPSNVVVVATATRDYSRYYNGAEHDYQGAHMLLADVVVVNVNVLLAVLGHVKHIVFCEWGEDNV